MLSPICSSSRTLQSLMNGAVRRSKKGVEQIQLTESDECSDVLLRTRRVSMNRGGNRTVAGNMMMRTCV